MQRVHSVGHNLERIHVQATVRLVEDRKGRIEHRHLEDLVPLFLSTGETDVDLALGELRLHLDESHLLLHKFQKITGFHRLLPLSLQL